MRREMRTVNVISNEAGTISDRAHASVKVHFDLVETRDFVDGVPDLGFCFGNLRFEDQAKSEISSFVLYGGPLVLAGGGIKTTILLNGPNAFTVVSAIEKNYLRKSTIAA